jgi:hypothetical protein
LDAWHGIIRVAGHQIIITEVQVQFAGLNILKSTEGLMALAMIKM